MSTVSLFTGNSSSSNSLYGSSAAQQPSQQATTQTTEQQDTVKLSEQAQAKLLYKQGESVSTIASSLGTTAKAIDNYLGITVDEELQQAIQQSIQASA